MANAGPASVDRVGHADPGVDPAERLAQVQAADEEAEFRPQDA